MNWINSFMEKICFIIFLLYSLLGYPQDDNDPCGEISDPSIQKLYDKAKNHRKYEYKQRISFFKEAIELDEECVLCMWDLAKLTFRNAQAKGISMEFSKKYFHLIEKICPEYHADVYYFLSLIYYSETNDCQTVKYFKKFLEFPSLDENKLASNYTDQVSSVKLTLPVADFYCEFYSNPVSFNPMLVRNVSTANSNEFLPVISPDNEQIFYTREYEHMAKGDIVPKLFQDFSMSTRDNVNNDFDSGKPLPPPFNVGPQYGGATISINNKELYICVCNQNGAYSNCDIFKTTYEFHDKGEIVDTVAYKWTELENLGPNINGPQSWEAQPSLSADGQTLYFASARAGGKGKIDIYYSERQADGSWGKAKNMGSTINTPESDKSPFIHTDSKTLYFVSKTSEYRLGAGEFDIFYTRQDKKTGKWSVPENIGYPINSEGNEEAIIVSSDGHYAYYSSERSDIGAGGKDIFYFSIPEKAKPDKVVILKGKIDAYDIESIQDAELQVRYKSGETYKQNIKIEDDGQYVAIANIGKGDEDVVLELKKDGKAFESKLIKKEESDNTYIKGQDLKIMDIEKGSAYTINDILFETNSSKIDPASELVLDAFAEWLKDNKDVKIEIQGHTDDIGAEEENFALSKDRAFSVMEYLLTKNIEISRLSFKGYGELNPKYSNDSAENRAMNRRTDFFIL